MKLIVFQAVKKDQKACAICHVDFKKEDDIELTKCGHYFHWDCLLEGPKQKSSESTESTSMNGCVHFPLWRYISKRFQRKSRSKAQNEQQIPQIECRLCPSCHHQMEISLHEKVTKLNEKLENSGIGGFDLENLHKLSLHINFLLQSGLNFT
uniref:RING-type domain-containing protein n=1 Tax=Meloidogyne javanica TaxID=6303 RepID=A0A915LUZ6_MELJA